QLQSTLPKTLQCLPSNKQSATTSTFISTLLICHTCNRRQAQSRGQPLYSGAVSAAHGPPAARRCPLSCAELGGLKGLIPPGLLCAAPAARHGPARPGTSPPQGRPGAGAAPAGRWRPGRPARPSPRAGLAWPGAPGPQPAPSAAEVVLRGWPLVICVCWVSSFIFY
uniref:Uncharacterized protein n=1 Tax=Zonotrichia albicollis TaxID=44394 RepID=A0A8D2M771_ZONAL